MLRCLQILIPCLVILGYQILINPPSPDTSLFGLFIFSSIALIISTVIYSAIFALYKSTKKYMFQISLLSAVIFCFLYINHGSAANADEKFRFYWFEAPIMLSMVFHPISLIFEEYRYKKTIK